MSRSAVDSPLWLSHHWPEHYQRCVRLGGRHVCRRCVALYPIAAVSAVAVATIDLPEQLLLAAMWLLPAPMAIEWTLEHLGAVRYSARRQLAVTVLGAPALGAALGIHARQPFSLSVVAPIVFWALGCALVAVLAARRSPDQDPTWESRHEADEIERRERLARLIDADEPLPSSTLNSVQEPSSGGSGGDRCSTTPSDRTAAEAREPHLRSPSRSR